MGTLRVKSEVHLQRYVGRAWDWSSMGRPDELAALKWGMGMQAICRCFGRAVGKGRAAALC